MFTDKNGTELNVADKVMILGHVASVQDNSASISLTKFGQSASLTFLRTEPVKVTTANGQVSGTVNGDPVNANDGIAIVGEVTALAPGIHTLANVKVTESGNESTLTFYCSEVIKASIDQESGVVSGPSTG